jgi:SPOR domain/Tetratricopeptide repeat
MMKSIGLGVVMTACASLPPLLHAQDDPRLIEVVQVAQDGKGDSARVIVARILAETPTADTLYPQVLYTMGLVAGSVADMRRLYQRIYVEFATSAWADDALLRIGMLDYAAGDRVSAARNLDRLRSDYPQSPLIPQASLWAARAYFDLRKTSEACTWLGEGLAQVGEDVELANQLNFYNGRCSPSARLADSIAAAATPARPPPAAPAKPPTAPAQAPAAPTQAPTEPAQAPTTTTGFSVQVAAVLTEVAADKVLAALAASGFKPHIVKEGGYYKVRVGHYSDKASAQATAADIKAKLGGAPFVVEES